MKTTRLEAFSDGVIAILITIMVLELKAPHGHEWATLKPLWPVFLSYLLSFVYLGIYWNNHHHLFHLGRRVSGPVMWANLHLLFWLSLISFSTAWMGENHFESIPTAVYGGVLLGSAVAFVVLQRTIVRLDGPDGALAHAVGSDRKGKLSLVGYLLGIVLSFAVPWLAWVLYAAVAVMWLVPDRRMERVMDEAS